MAELIVVLFIVTVVSTVIIGNISSFSSRAQLRNIAQNLSLDVRRAQIYGVTVKEAKPGTTSSYKSYTTGYGVVLRLDHPNMYVLFGDRPVTPYPADPTAPLPVGNGLFNAGTIIPDGWSAGGCNFDSSTIIGNRNECLQQITIPTNFMIYAICANNNDGVIHCSSMPPTYPNYWTQDSSLNEVDITYTRPSSIGRIIFNRDPSIYPQALSTIIILSTTDQKQFISYSIYKSGQILISSLN